MDNYDVLKSKGVEVIACVSVNDAFVMDAWGKSQGATGKIRMLADTSGEFTKVCTIIIYAVHYLIAGNIGRSKKILTDFKIGGLANK